MDKRQIAPEGTKWCPQCRTFVAREKFYADARLKDGLRHYCHPCDLAWQLRWRRAQGMKPKARPTGDPGTIWCSVCHQFLRETEFGASRITCLKCLRERQIRRQGGLRAKPKGRRLQIPVATGQRRCTRCTHIKPLSEFYRVNNGLRFASRCKTCTGEIFQSYAVGRKSEWTKRARRKTRDIVFDYYGRECTCCGTTEVAFLTIDHVTGDGAAHRRRLGRGNKGAGSARIYSWLLSQGFPVGFQTLCRNCNWSKWMLGRCPHASAVQGHALSG